MRVKRGYLCSTAFAWDLCPENAGSVQLYGSPEALRTLCGCIGEGRHDCRIVEVEVRLVETHPTESQADAPE